MVNINLFGGPGTGKSTIAAGLFYNMKLKNIKVENIGEYAKDLTYGKDFVKLSDQLLLLGEQHHKMFRLKDELDYIIHDSPFISGMMYADDELIPIKEFEELILAVYHRYNHINIFLTRNLNNEYQEYGRNQTLDESIQKDNEIKNWLNTHNIKFYEVLSSENSVKDIYKIVEKIRRNTQEKETE